MDKLKRKLISNLQNYLRERQDFIASIPTMDPAWSAPFDIILNIFEPILGALDENGEPVDKGKCPNLFLLFDNIVRSEGVRTGAIQFKIKIFSKSQQEEVSYKFTKDGNGIVGYQREGSLKGNYKAAIYLGTSGCQAFYSIIENILRNVTRHSKKESITSVILKSDEFLPSEEKFFKNIKLNLLPRPLEVTIEFYYDDSENKYKEDYILVKIYDNMGGWKEIRNGKDIWKLEEDGEIKAIVVGENGREGDARNWLKNCYNKIKKISDESKKEQEIDRLLLNRKFSPQYPEGKIIDETGQVIQGSWGLKEMRICASFLRGLKISEYELEHNPPVITPIIVKNGKDKEGSLGYKFYLPRVKNLLIISNKIEINNNKEKFKNNGIYIEKDIKIITEGRSTFTHEFVLIDVDNYENLQFLKSNILRLPYKLFYLTENKNRIISEIKNLDISGNKNAVEKRIIEYNEFENWLNNNSGKIKINRQEIQLAGPSERLILEVKKRWIEYLLNCSQIPKVCFYPYNLGDSYIHNRLIYCHQAALPNKNLTCEFLKEVSKSVILLHRFDRYNEIAKQEPFAILPFAHGESSPITKIKMDFQQSKGSLNFNILSSYFDVLEIGLTNTVIIDERIFNEFASGKTISKFNDFPFSRSWFVQNVVAFNVVVKDKGKIKLKCLNLKNNTSISVAEDEIKNISVYLPNFFENKLHFLIIHQTIIDTQLNGNEGLQDFINSLPDRFKPWYVVVTSGRGHPFNMPKNSKFLDFSNLRKVIIENIDKFLFVKQLWGVKE